MEINRTNYEAYFIDYLEGNLDEQLVNSFIEFIKQNPDLKKELEFFEPISVEPDPVTFNKKENLYKEKYDSDTEFDTTAVARLEGDLSKKEQTAFAAYLANHPNKEKEADLFQHTVLKADETIVFTKKKGLYKKPMGRTLLLWSGRVAAVFILAFAIFSLIDRKEINENQGSQLAKTEVVVPETTEKNHAEKPIIPEKETAAPVNPTTITEKEVIAEATNPEQQIKNLPEQKPVSETQQELVAYRTPVHVPEPLTGITASIEVPVVKADLAVMYITIPPEHIPDEWLLADKVKEKFNIRKISRAGLDLIASISDERFSYETNNEGKVNNYKYDSRLLAFSIPSNQTNPK